MEFRQQVRTLHAVRNVHGPPRVPVRDPDRRLFEEKQLLAHVQPLRPLAGHKISHLVLLRRYARPRVRCFLSVEQLAHVARRPHTENQPEPLIHPMGSPVSAHSDRRGDLLEGRNLLHAVGGFFSHFPKNAISFDKVKRPNSIDFADEVELVATSRCLRSVMAAGSIPAV